jgi:hypothetical protein
MWLSDGGAAGATGGRRAEARSCEEEDGRAEQEGRVARGG